MWYEIPGFDGWYAVNEKREFRTVKRPIKVSASNTVIVNTGRGRTSVCALSLYAIAMKHKIVWNRFSHIEVRSKFNDTLTVRLHNFYDMKIDEADWEMLKESTIYGEPYYDEAKKYVLVSVVGERRNIGVHSIICPAPEGLVTDHIDRDKLNNTRNNLRAATHQENAFNRNVSGVNFQNGGWLARIMKNGVSHNLGKFKTKDEALRARIEAENEMFGNFSKHSLMYYI